MSSLTWQSIQETLMCFFPKNLFMFILKLTTHKDRGLSTKDKDRAPKHKKSNINLRGSVQWRVFRALNCRHNNLYIGGCKHIRNKTSGLESVVCLHLKDKGHTFEQYTVHFLDRWFELRPSMSRWKILLSTEVEI